MPKLNNKPLPPCMSPGFYSAYDPDHWRARKNSTLPSIGILLFIVAMATIILWLIGPTVFGVAAAILNGLADT